MNETTPIEAVGSVAPETPVRRAETETTAATLATEPGVVAEEKPSTVDNIITLGLVGILAAVVIALVIRKIVQNKKPAAVEVEQVSAAPAADAPTAPGAAGEVKLNNVDPKTAAMLMAIVADKMGRPINELRFISIKEVE